MGKKRIETNKQRCQEYSSVADGPPSLRGQGPGWRNTAGRDLGEKQGFYYEVALAK